MASITHDYKQWGTGSCAGNTSGQAIPVDQSCKTVLIKAEVANAGNVYIGKSGVTSDPTTDTSTCGYQLDAGQEVRLMVGNLNEVYFKSDNEGDDITYLWQG